MSIENQITNDGFGIHTLELTIPYMTKYEMWKIRERLENDLLNTFYDNSHKTVIIYPKYPGIRIYLNHPVKHKYYIRMIINPNKILNPQSDYLSIMNENSDVNAFGTKINDVIADLFGENYNIDSFSLSRIDCCVNIMLSKDFSAERYVKLIGRSIKCSPDMIITYSKKDRNFQMKNKHSFNLQTNFGEFTAYDKYFQLEDIKADYNAVSDALLRLELKFNRRHIKRTSDDNSEQISDNTDIIALYLHNSRRYFENFVKRNFSYGKYYTVNKMLKIVEASQFRKKEKARMAEHIKSQCYAEHRKSAMKKTRTKLKSDRLFYNMMFQFEILDMSPISLSARDKHDDCYVPNIYELLNIKQEELL